ncbi:hypothetical protein ACWCQ1_51795 [Streptomyces sp. NPDC002144]
MRKKNRVIGLVASSVAAVGLAALAATSAGAATATAGDDAKPAGHAKPGDIKNNPAGVLVKRTAHGILLKALTKDEAGNTNGWKSTKPAGQSAGHAKPAGQSAGHAKPGDIKNNPAGVLVKRTAHGILLKALTKDEAGNTNGWKSTKPASQSAGHAKPVDIKD